LGCFNNGIDIPIPFRKDANISDLKQIPYGFSKRDRDAADAILDPLRKAGIIEPVLLGQPLPYTSPGFIVYRDGKPRFVVDLHRVNTKLYQDTYPLPKQDDILEAMGGGSVFSCLDITKSFFQQPIRVSDWWKTAFVTPYRGHEQLTVSIMGLSTSPAFFQYRMEKLFGGYLWKFVLVYINNTIIFSRDIETHIDHLSSILRILSHSGVTLNLSKCHFAQPGLKALGHWVDRLGLSTLDEKVEAVREMRFPGTLAQLENTIGFFNYYRKFVDHYTGISQPMQVLKTLGFKGAPI
jgi:hypothetical protein